MPYKKLVSKKQPVTLTNKFSLLTKNCAHVSLQIFNIFFELLIHVFDISREKQNYEKTIQKTILFNATNYFGIEKLSSCTENYFSEQHKQTQ